MQRTVAVTGRMVPSSIIHVDRMSASVYPDSRMRAIIPSMQSLGPSEFNLDKLRKWRHSRQLRHESVRGYIISMCLRKKSLLSQCFNFQDLQEIQRKGLLYFLRYFGKSIPCAWRSSSRLGERKLVPCLTKGDSRTRAVIRFLPFDMDFASVTWRFSIQRRLSSRRSPKHSLSVHRTVPEFLQQL